MFSFEICVQTTALQDEQNKDHVVVEVYDKLH